MGLSFSRRQFLAASGAAAANAQSENEHPETIARATMIRTLDYKLVARPDGQSEFYDLRKDPRELHNVYGERAYGAPQDELHARMLDWYIRYGRCRTQGARSARISQESAAGLKMPCSRGADTRVCGVETHLDALRR